MTANELSVKFDMLYNNITSNKAPGLNEYEKSVFLTKAQNEIVKNYFLPQSNSKRAGFEDNQRRQINFSPLIKITALDIDATVNAPHVHTGSLLYKMTSDNTSISPLVIVDENITVTVGDGTSSRVFDVKVIPISLIEHSRLMQKPYKEPVKGQAWRLLSDSNDLEVVLRSADKPNGATFTYKIAYVEKPTPIVLDSLSNYGTNLQIEGQTTVTLSFPFEESMYDEILQRAVELAKIVWLGNIQETLTAGEKSE
ncbi:MAG: hypothetical protein IJU02_07125 [Lachnospiraceae bacterium]|nr:hypothetical protein [Lachnospiraceae bacterium]